jgi:hypothetical protein
LSATERTRSISAEATVAAGRALAQNLRPGDVILLEGDLAAGKTTLVRGVVDGAHGDPTEVSSPSFVLIQTYDCDSGKLRRLHHVDLYRLANRAQDLREVGLEEVLSDPSAAVAVEWPRDTLADWLPIDARVWRIVLVVEHDDSRMITVHAPTSA